MSRSGYNDDCEQWDLIRWRGAVASAIRGKRGQDMLKEMLAALDALPEKRLISEELQDEYDSNCVCALGALGRARGVDMTNIDPDDRETVAAEFDIAHALACEIMWENDEGGWRETPESRYFRMRKWIESKIRNAQAAAESSGQS
jgi:hypothetical protein